MLIFVNFFKRGAQGVQVVAGQKVVTESVAQGRGRWV